MDCKWTQLSADSDRHYQSGEFRKAVEGYTQLLSLSATTVSSQDVALVYNNRGHAKYMMVEIYFSTAALIQPLFR